MADFAERQHSRLQVAKQEYLPDFLDESLDEIFYNYSWLLRHIADWGWSIEPDEFGDLPEPPDLWDKLDELEDKVVKYMNLCFAIVGGEKHMTIVERRPDSKNGFQYQIRWKTEFESLYKADIVQLYKPSKKKGFVVKYFKSVATIWLSSPLARRYPGTIVYNAFPSDDFRAPNPDIDLNLFRWFLKTRDDCEPFKDFDLSLFWVVMFRIFNKNIADMYTVINHLTWVLHYSWIPLGFMPVLLGPQGIGKSFLYEEILGFLLGDNFLKVVNYSDLQNFNSIMKNKVFILLDDPGIRTIKDYNFMKSHITGKTFKFEEKYMDAKIADNIFNNAMAANLDSDRAVVPKEDDDRRYPCIKCKKLEEFLGYRNSEKERFFWGKLKHWLNGGDNKNQAGYYALGWYLWERAEEMHAQGFAPYQADGLMSPINQQQKFMKLTPSKKLIYLMLKSGNNFIIPEEKLDAVECYELVRGLHGRADGTLGINYIMEDEEDEWCRSHAMKAVDYQLIKDKVRALQEQGFSEARPDYGLKSVPVASGWVRYQSGDHLAELVHILSLRDNAPSKKQPTVCDMINQMREMGIVIGEHGRRQHVSTQRGPGKRFSNVVEFVPLRKAISNWNLATGITIDQVSEEQKMVPWERLPDIYKTTVAKICYQNHDKKLPFLDDYTEGVFPNYHLRGLTLSTELEAPTQSNNNNNGVDTFACEEQHRCYACQQTTEFCSSVTHMNIDGRVRVLHELCAEQYDYPNS